MPGHMPSAQPTKIAVLSFQCLAPFQMLDENLLRFHRQQKRFTILFCWYDVPRDEREALGVFEVFTKAGPRAIESHGDDVLPSRDVGRENAA